jgi:Ca2+-dependent lipid-binding protein
MYFLVSEECKQLKVEIYDEDIGRDDKLGHCHILRKDEDERGKLSGDYYYLEDGKGASVEIWTQEMDLSNGLGRKLAERYQAVQQYVAGKNRDNVALLEAYLHNAEGLKSGLIDKSDPYAKFDFSNDTQKDRIHPHKLRTKTIENNPSPVWEEVFHFLVPYDLDTFKVEIMDEDVGIDDSLGHVNIAVASVGTVKIMRTVNSSITERSVLAVFVWTFCDLVTRPRQAKKLF